MSVPPVISIRMEVAGRNTLSGRLVFRSRAFLSDKLARGANQRFRNLRRTFVLALGLDISLKARPDRNQVTIFFVTSSGP